MMSWTRRPKSAWWPTCWWRSGAMTRARRRRPTRESTQTTLPPPKAPSRRSPTGAWSTPRRATTPCATDPLPMTISIPPYRRWRLATPHQPSPAPRPRRASSPSASTRCRRPTTPSSPSPPPPPRALVSTVGTAWTCRCPRLPLCQRTSRLVPTPRIPFWASSRWATPAFLTGPWWTWMRACASTEDGGPAIVRVCCHSRCFG
mmetsp:Transcript_34595/g.81076  ORF Transcript_34595/g.81076 Transcript_34595/m.81076 type:complete len:203 (-) Transcript_34595:303-911(-)